MRNEKTRFDGQLPISQKEHFENAMMLGGFRSLTEFVFMAAQEKADDIIDHHNTILKSERDREIFFDLVMNPPEPNDKLKQAAKRYKELKNNMEATQD